MLKADFLFVIMTFCVIFKNTFTEDFVILDAINRAHNALEKLSCLR